MKAANPYFWNLVRKITKIIIKLVGVNTTSNRSISNNYNQVLKI